MIKAKTIPEYAKMKGVSIQTVYTWIKEDKVKTKKILGKTVIIL